MEYGYIKDTTIQSIAEGLRDKGIVPALRRTTIYNDTYDIYICAKSKTDPTYSSSGITQPESSGNSKWIVSAPEAAQLRFEIQWGKSHQGASAGAPVGYIYLYDANNSFVYFPISGSIQESELTGKIVRTIPTNSGYIQINRQTMSAGIDFGVIAKVYPLDAEGNELKGVFPEEVDITNTVSPSEMIEAIENCPKLPPDSAYTISGDRKCAFYNGAWDWFIETYGDLITTEAITNSESMFEYSKAKEIPFTLNVKSPSSMNSMFGSMHSLKTCPKIRGSFGNSWPYARVCITSAYRLRDAEDLITADMIAHVKDIKVTSAYQAGYQFKFTHCYSLRKVPSWWKLQKLSPESTVIPNSSIAGLYPDCFNNCYVLDEVLDIPVWACTGTATSNMFGSMFNKCNRIKAVTFETDNGAPIAAKWKSQTIDLYFGLGSSYAAGTNSGNSADYMLKYNSGITADKEVKDAATYQALKNDPDWWTNLMTYSRYNHDSAVETINSLPDTSAYLVTAGGTNTIKFNKRAGSLTDGGAIENLTAEEIAVAAAKGWTVTLS